MKSLLHTLNDNEAVLLMYLFDELPAEDRAEVEEMLLTDPSLRAEFEQLKETRSFVDAAFESTDARLASPRSEAAVRRSTYGLFEQWNNRRLLKQVATAVRTPSRLKWAMYVAGAAVAAVVAVTYIWVINHGDDSFQGLPPVDNVAQVSPEEDDQLAGSFENHNDTEVTNALADARVLESSDLLRRSLDTTEEMLKESLVHADLAAAEQEIHAIAILSDLRSVDDNPDANQFQ